MLFFGLLLWPLIPDYSFFKLTDWIELRAAKVCVRAVRLLDFLCTYSEKFICWFTSHLKGV